MGNLLKLENEEENYYEAIRVGSFHSNYDIEYESIGNRTKARSVEECLNKIRSFE